MSASDLNGEFNNIVNNGEDLGWPATKAKDLDGQELILDGDADTSITANTDDQIDFRIGGTDRGRWISTGLAIGTVLNPDGTLHIHTATAGSATADTTADDLTVENSADGGISILVPDASVSNLRFGSPTDSSGAVINYQHSVTQMKIGTSIANGLVSFLSANSVENMRLDSSGALFIGDTINAQMTIGLTVNQGASDNQVHAFKSSDVGHAMTGIVEADTFGEIRKAEGTSGGTVLRGFKDADGTAGLALSLAGVLGEAADTTDLTTSNAVIRVVGSVTDGGTGDTVVADAGNLFNVENNGTARLLVKGDGTLHATNVTAGDGDLDGVALDHEDDIALVRVFERTVHKGLGIAMSKWDEGIKNSEDDLKRLGVLSSEGHFYNMQRMNSLLGGAIWQLHTNLMEILERLALAERKLAILPNKGTALMELGESDG